MRTVTFTLERDDEGIYVFADLFGFFLWSSDVEKILQSVVPLAQHLFWRNEKLCMAPQNELDAVLLLAGTAEVSFEQYNILRAPKLLVEGEWCQNEEGKALFIPVENGMMSNKIVDRALAVAKRTE